MKWHKWRLTIVLGLAAALAGGVHLFWPGGSGKRSEEREDGTGGRGVTEHSVAKGLASPLMAIGSDRTLAYQFNLNQNGELNAHLFSSLKPSAGRPGEKGPGTVALKVEATGKLCLKFFAVEDHARRVAGKILSPDVRLNGLAASYAQALASPFTFSLQSNGVIEDLRFPANMPEEASAFITSLILKTQIVFPSTARTSYRDVERDEIGPYDAVYNVEPGQTRKSVKRITKRKVAYIGKTGASADLIRQEMPALSELRYRVIRSEAMFDVSLSGDGILDMHLDEEVATEASGKELSRYDGSVHLKRAEEDVCGHFPETFDAVIQEMASIRYAMRPDRSTDPSWNKIAEGLDMEGALEQFQELRGSPADRGRAAKAFMVHYLRMRPEASRELIRLLNGDPDHGQWDKETQLLLWYLITEAGTPEAQQAIIDAAKSRGLTNLSHIRALFSASQFKDPGKPLVEGLWDLYHHPEVVGRNTDVRDVRNMSILAIGVLGSNEKGHQAFQKDIAAGLVQTLGDSTNQEERAAVLGAIGNTGNPAVLDDIRPYFKNESEEVRMASYDALRRMDDPRAFELLTSSFEAESSAKVRAAALETLSKMPPSEGTVSWARYAVASLKSPDEKTPLVRLLGTTLSRYPENESALRDVLASRPPVAVEREVYRYIGPRRP